MFNYIKVNKWFDACCRELFSENVGLAICHSVFVKGDHTNLNYNLILVLFVPLKSSTCTLEASSSVTLPQLLIRAL